MAVVVLRSWLGAGVLLELRRCFRLWVAYATDRHFMNQFGLRPGDFVATSLDAAGRVRLLGAGGVAVGRQSGGRVPRGGSGLSRQIAARLDRRPNNASRRRPKPTSRPQFANWKPKSPPLKERRKSRSPSNLPPSAAGWKRSSSHIRERSPCGPGFAGGCPTTRFAPLWRSSWPCSCSRP